MALFDNTLLYEILGLIQQHHHKLGSALGMSSTIEKNEQLHQSSELFLDVTLLIEIANGVHGRTEALVHDVEQALTRVLGYLLDSPLNARSSLPADFWQTAIGILVSRTRWWVSAEDLITISNAAALAFGENSQPNRMRIARAMDSGVLDWVPDPSVTNSQHNRRVLRSQVERLRDLRRLPE